MLDDETIDRYEGSVEFQNKMLTENVNLAPDSDKYASKFLSIPQSKWYLLFDLIMFCVKISKGEENYQKTVTEVK